MKLLQFVVAHKTMQKINNKNRAQITSDIHNDIAGNSRVWYRSAFYPCWFSLCACTTIIATLASKIALKTTCGEASMIMVFSISIFSTCCFSFDDITHFTITTII